MANSQDLQVMSPSTLQGPQGNPAQSSGRPDARPIPAEHTSLLVTPFEVGGGAASAQQPSSPDKNFSKEKFIHCNIHCRKHECRHGMQ